MEPVMHDALEVHLTAVIAPTLEFIEAAAISSWNAQFDQAEVIIGSLLLAQAQFGAVPGGEIGEDFVVEEIDQDLEILSGGRGRC